MHLEDDDRPWISVERPDAPSRALYGSDTFVLLALAACGGQDADVVSLVERFLALDAHLDSIERQAADLMARPEATEQFRKECRATLDMGSALVELERRELLACWSPGFFIQPH
jgi:hypothetical protein